MDFGNAILKGNIEANGLFALALFWRFRFKL